MSERRNSTDTFANLAEVFVDARFEDLIDRLQAEDRLKEIALKLACLPLRPEMGPLCEELRRKWDEIQSKFNSDYDL